MKGLVQFTPILPKYLWDASGTPRKVYQELLRQGKIVERMYKKTVRTWKNKPRFKTKVRGKRMRYGMGYELTVSYDRRTKGGQHYFYTDWGTKRHVIRARRAPRLRFRTKSTPKTRVRVIGSRRGSRGGTWAAPKAVMHPGTEARMFTAEIQDRRREPIQNAIIGGIRSGTKKKSYRG